MRLYVDDVCVSGDPKSPKGPSFCRYSFRYSNRYWLPPLHGLCNMAECMHCDPTPPIALSECTWIHINLPTIRGSNRSTLEPLPVKCSCNANEIEGASNQIETLVRTLSERMNKKANKTSYVPTNLAFQNTMSSIYSTLICELLYQGYFIPIIVFFPFKYSITTNTILRSGMMTM